ncbi:hypothetical protein QIH01_23270 [Brevibacillus brevis]|nr:hypothetical protein QIH01_23270 [Brevibacillus brevis]
MEKITYAQYLQENIGVIPMGECLEVINAAEQGKLSDLEIEEQLTPVVGTIFVELLNSDKEAFNSLLNKVKTVCEVLKEQEGTRTFTLCPSDNANALVQQIDSILSDIRDGWKRVDHWLDHKGDLVIVLQDSNLAAGHK